jgi:hypothetical protein
MNQPAFRRDVMLAALLSSLPIGLVESAAASPLNPEQTIIRPPAELQWKPNTPSPAWTTAYWPETSTNQGFTTP